MREPFHPAPAVLIVMGVSGAGKTTIGALLAERLGWEFVDGDFFHPAANVEKMRSGIPLTDEDRWPWLQAIAEWIDRKRRDGGHAVIACSALKRSYRAAIVGQRRDVGFIYLKGARALIARRQAFHAGEPVGQPIRSAGRAYARRKCDRRVHRAASRRDH